MARETKARTAAPARGSHQTAPRAWQRMLSGRRLDLLEPSPLDIEIADIAHGLARVPRWNGQTRGPYAFSVAQHALLVESIAAFAAPDASAELRLIVLLHDAPEYVIGDMISPFKAVIGEAYKDVERRLQQAIHLRYGLPATPPAAARALTKKADQVAAYFEATALAGFGDAEARQFFGIPRGITLDDVAAVIEPVAVEEAAQRFLERFHSLEAERASPKPLGRAR
jgi:uncharacterized protein